MLRLAYLALFLACACAWGVAALSPALAQQTAAGPYTGTGGITAFTVTTSSSQALPASPRSAVLTIQNVGTTNPVACALGATAALNTAGSFQIAAGQLLTLSNQTYVPGDAINCIASTSSTPITIFAK